MKSTLICKIVALAVVVSLSATSALARGSGAFNRPHLGTNWVVLTGGSLSISNPRAAWHIWVARLLKGFEQGHGCLCRCVPGWY
jgi:hypothetical protein